jgi:hypothetical protein
VVQSYHTSDPKSNFTHIFYREIKLSEDATRKLRQLFNKIREDNDVEETYQIMQRILPTDRYGDPYSRDQIWAWMLGADTTELEDHANYYTGYFVQNFEDEYGNVFSLRMSIPQGESTIDAFTTSRGQQAILATGKRAAERRADSPGIITSKKLTLGNIRPINPRSRAKIERVQFEDEYFDMEEDYFEPVEE